MWRTRVWAFLLKNCGEYALAQFDRLVGMMNSDGYVFRTAGGLAAEWDQADV